jgi:hypothetical protein
MKKVHFETCNIPKLVNFGKILFEIIWAERRA